MYKEDYEPIPMEQTGYLCEICCLRRANQKADYKRKNRIKGLTGNFICEDCYDNLPNKWSEGIRGYFEKCYKMEAHNGRDT